MDCIHKTLVKMEKALKTFVHVFNICFTCVFGTFPFKSLGEKTFCTVPKVPVTSQKKLHYIDVNGHHR